MSRAGIMRLFVVACVLSLATFAYVLLAAPIDPERSPRARALTQRPSLFGTVNRVREHLLNERFEQAVSLAHRLRGSYPQNIAACLEYAQALELAGDYNAARNEWSTLLTMLPDDRDRGSSSENVMYHRARALHALGETALAQELFLACAYSEMSKGALRSSYNAACYLAMGGATEAALEEWALSSGVGVGGWWSVDPDLAPIRDDERFWVVVRDSGVSEPAEPLREP